MLALLDEEPPLILTQGGGVLSQGITLGLALLHEHLVGGKLFLHLLTQRAWLKRGFKKGYLMVDDANGGLFLLEMTAGSHEVEDWRHEVFMLRLAVECAGEGSEESPLHYQHPEHLAALELVVPFGMLVEVTAHPVCCCDAKRVRFVA